MQSYTPPPQKPSSLKKWLPAVLFAIAIHALLFVIFYNSQSTPKSDNILIDKEAANQSKSNNLPAIKDEGLNTDSNKGEIEVNLESALKANANNNIASKQDKVKSKQTGKTLKEDTVTQNKDKKSVNTSMSNNTSDNKSKEIVSKGSNETEVTSLKTDPIEPKRQQSIPNPLPNEINKQALAERNDQLLLPMDLPQSNSNNVNRDGKLSNEAKQADKLNTQLGDIIRKVKDRKVKEIEDQLKINKTDHSNVDNSENSTQNSVTQ